MLASVVGPDGTATFRYDGMGRLHKATTAAGDVIYYAHDAFGRRIARIKNGLLDKGWIYANGLSPIAQLNGAGQLEATYVYASRPNIPDFIVERAGASNVTYRVIADHLGTPRRLVRTSDGAVVYALDVDEWGRVVNESGTKSALVPFGFAGGLLDRDTGLVRFGARDYDPETGRWTAKDSILFEGGQRNLYAYVGNDPANFSDSMGLIAGVDDAAFLAGAATATAAAAGALYGWCIAGGCEAVAHDLQQGWQHLVNWADNAREKDLLKHLADVFGVPWKQLSDELHKIKKNAGLKGKSVDIAPDGTVTDPVSGEEIGNICDK
jgi:RHS repeat-associated protein